jgi:1-acyl-sn-glycerol-3-phosphate acyltransferase
VESLQKNAPPFFNRGGVTISNHISYTDILAIASQTPSLFVTSTDMRDTLGLGWLCRLGGSEFVNRKNPGGLRQELARLTQLIQSGKHVVFFPEATSTRGDELKPFKAALFESVRESDAPLWILAIHYRPELVRRLSFAEEDSFLSHAHQTFLLESSSIQLHWLKKMEPEALALQTARDLAKNSHRLIHKALFERTDAINPSL